MKLIALIAAVFLSACVAGEITWEQHDPSSTFCFWDRYAPPIRRMTCLDHYHHWRYVCWADQFGNVSTCSRVEPW